MFQNVAFGRLFCFERNAFLTRPSPPLYTTKSNAFPEIKMLLCHVKHVTIRSTFEGWILKKARLHFESILNSIFNTFLRWLPTKKRTKNVCAQLHIIHIRAFQTDKVLKITTPQQFSKVSNWLQGENFSFCRNGSSRESWTEQSPIWFMFEK